MLRGDVWIPLVCVHKILLCSLLIDLPAANVKDAAKSILRWLYCYALPGVGPVIDQNGYTLVTGKHAKMRLFPKTLAIFCH